MNAKAAQEVDVAAVRHQVLETQARLGLSRAEIARQANVPGSTVTQWLDDKYYGNNEKIARDFLRWLKAIEDQAAHLQARSALREPGYVETPTAVEVTNILAYAQTAPEMTLVTLGAGMGKTSVARQYVATRPHAHRITVRPKASNMYTLVGELAVVLGITERNPAFLDRAIGNKLKRNGNLTLLIIDEAQQLADQAINQLRYYLDEYGCGIALLGNEEIYNRFGRGDVKEGYGQIHRRIGMRLRRLAPLEGDITAMIAAWGIEDPEQVKLLTAIGHKHGALGQIDKTIRLASILAQGQQREMNAADIRSAWQNRGGEVQ